jgi:hypothetical protein
MKKTFSVMMVLVLSLALVSAALAAAPAPGGPFSTAFRVQNLETTDAACSYVFYSASGATAYTSASATIAPGDSLYVYTPALSGLADGEYSGVVSCDKQVAAVVNFSDPNSAAAYNGVSAPGLVWYAPGIYNNYYNYYSNIYVQNASSGTVNITVEIFAPGNPVPVATQTATNVAANAAVHFEQEGLAGLNTNQFYSAKITGTGDIAPVVNIYGRGSVNDQLYSYNPVAAGSTTAYAPVIMNNYYGYNSALVIQNMGSVASDITVTYTNGWTHIFTVQPGAAQSLYTPLESGIPAGNTLYGATVVSTNSQPLVVVVNESNQYNRAASYTGFSSGSAQVRAPIVMKNYYSFNSSVTCQNVGSAATTMTIAYAGIAGTTTSGSVSVGGTWLFYQPVDPVLAGVPINWISSATVTSAQPIVCIVNQDQGGSYATQLMDQLAAYDGIAP